MTEWISVKDRLPKFDQVVMVCYPSGYNGEPLYAFGARVDDSDGWLWGVQSGYSGGIYAKEEAGDNSIEADDDYPVQFWCPLPEPPALSNGELK
jgi:hypothetical protein